MIADATDEAAAFHHDVDVGGHEELDAAAEGVDVNNQMNTHIEHHEDAEISCPGLLGDLCKPTPMYKAPDGRQLQQTGHNENNSDNRSWFHNYHFFKLAAKVRRTAYPSKFLG